MEFTRRECRELERGQVFTEEARQVPGQDHRLQTTEGLNTGAEFCFLGTIQQQMDLEAWWRVRGTNGPQTLGQNKSLWSGGEGRELDSHEDPSGNQMAEFLMGSEEPSRLPARAAGTAPEARLPTCGPDGIGTIGLVPSKPCRCF